MAYIDRDQFIALLERLGSDRDSDVLRAARDIHRTLHEAGISWNDLLIPDGEDDESEPLDEEENEYESESEEDFDDDYEDDEDQDYEDDDEEFEGEDEEPVSDTKEDRDLIQRILKEFKVSQETRDDLKDLQEDIDAGVFTESDRRYLHALIARLQGSK